MNRRAYSVLNVKDISERDDVFVVRGIASTPTTDRMGDVVEPLGAKFKTPMPLLWQHQSDKPVGLVTFAKPEKDGIPFVAELPNVKEAGALKERIDEAIQSIKYRLVAAVSIGFKEVAGQVERLKDGGLHFLEWDWMELSLVTIPANAEATITHSHIKSWDGASARPVLRFSPPGLAGTQPPTKGPDMTTQEQIAALEAKRAAQTARREEIQKKALAENRTKDATEKEAFDTITAELKAIDEELVDLRVLAADELKSAKPAAGAAPAQAAASRGAVEVRDGFVRTQPNVEKGVRFARAAMALIQAKGNRSDAAAIAKSNQRWMDQTPDVEMYLKTAVAAGDSTTSGWASQLAYARDMESEFVDLLRPMTILGKLNTVRRVPFNIRYGTQTAGSTGNWVGQGSPIPVSKPTVSSGSLGIAKASALVAIDEELAKLSSPSAEMLVRDDMAKTLATFLDVQFVDPNVAASANVNPASITNGVTLTAASGTAASNLRTDLATLLTNMSRNEIDISTVVWIMTPETALNISLLLNSLGLPLYPELTVSGGTLLGRPVITSNSANIPGSPASGRMIIAVAAPEILLADEGQVSIDVSREAAIELLDNPTNTSTGSTAATSMVSMFQTHSLALRATRWINWAKRRSTAVEYIKEAAYVA